MSEMDERRGKWEDCYRAAADTPAIPCVTLREHAGWLPVRGEALDLACGRGGNALFLARQGLATHAWDYARSALDALSRDAARQGLIIHTACRDALASPPAPQSFDVIVVANFLDRRLFPALVQALRPGGLLYYDTWLGPRQGAGPSSPDFRLRAGELPRLTGAALLELSYEEDNDRARLVGRKSGAER